MSEKINPIDQDPIKKEQLLDRLRKTDDIIFIIFIVILFLLFIVPAIGELVINNQGFIDLFKYDPTVYNQTTEATSQNIIVILVVVLVILFWYHFKLRGLLGQKGIDSLAERLRDLLDVQPPKEKK